MIPTSKGFGRIILGRHGETEWNREGRIMGQSDSCLTEDAHGIIENLADMLVDFGVGRIFSSSLGRAALTSSSYAMKLQVPLHFRDSVSELSAGAWEGCLRSVVGGRTTSLRPTWEEKPPQGESYADAEPRVRGFLEEICTLDQQTLLIIGHAGINRVILKEFFTLDQGIAMRVLFPHNVLYVIEHPDNIFPVGCKINAGRGLILNSD
jgi:broad specificity phosphatase PhoE